MKKNKLIFIIIICLLVVIISFGIMYLVLNGTIKNFFVGDGKNEGDNNRVSYVLSIPVLPLEDIYDISYITTTSINIRGTLDNWAYTLYINNHGELVIKDDYTNEEKISTTVKNAKYIIDDVTAGIKVLTTDGKIYKHTSKHNIETSDTLDFQDIDSFKEFMPDDEEVTFSNIFMTTNGSMLSSLFAETTDGTYYDLHSTSINGGISSSRKSNNLEELIGNYDIDIVSEDYGFNVYYDGRITCSGSYENGYTTNKYELEIYDEEGNVLKGYKYLPVRNGIMYFVSLENKLYQLNYSNIQYDTKLVAKLINENVIKEISYDKNTKKDIIITFSNNETMEIVDAIFARSYNMFLD